MKHLDVELKADEENALLPIYDKSFRDSFRAVLVELLKQDYILEAFGKPLAQDVINLSLVVFSKTYKQRLWYNTVLPTELFYDVSVKQLTCIILEWVKRIDEYGPFKQKECNN